MLIVVTPAEDHRLTTLETAKAELRVQGTGDDAYLVSLIDRASATVRRYCNRTFALETVQETSGPGSRDCIQLQRWPVVAVVSITSDGATLASDGYQVDASTGELARTGNAWWAGSVVVTYRAGYVLPGVEARTLPEDIEQATLALVRAEWFARDRDPAIRTDAVEGIGSTSYTVGALGSGGLLADVSGVLDRHRAAAIG